jgi:hypothetical protein
MCIRCETREKARRSLALSRVTKPHTHITYMLRQCTSIVYILYLYILYLYILYLYILYTSQRTIYMKFKKIHFLPIVPLSTLSIRKVWRYQRGIQKSWSEGQTIQQKKNKKTNNNLQNTTQKHKDGQSWDKLRQWFNYIYVLITAN